METCSVLASLSVTNPRDVSKDGFAASVSDGGMNLCRILRGKPCLGRSLSLPSSDASSAEAPSSSVLAVLGPAEAAEAEAFHRRFHQLHQGSNLPKAAEGCFLAGNQGPKD